jgi:hypothetical protein
VAGGGGARVDWTDPATLTVWLAIFYPNPMTGSFTGRLGENCEGFDYSVGKRRDVFPYRSTAEPESG